MREVAPPNTPCPQLRRRLATRQQTAMRRSPKNCPTEQKLPPLPVHLHPRHPLSQLPLVNYSLSTIHCQSHRSKSARHQKSPWAYTVTPNLQVHDSAHVPEALLNACASRVLNGGLRGLCFNRVNTGAFRAKSAFIAEKRAKNADFAAVFAVFL